MAQYRVTARLLNVRNAPSYVADIVSVLHNGDIIEVQEICNGWARIRQNSWVVAKYLSALDIWEQLATKGKKIFL